MSNLIQCMIIDDELNNIKLLSKMLQMHCPDLCILHTETNAQKGLTAIGELKPDLVFLDIQMPKLSGFELLKKLEPLSFEVIFVTAHNEYAIQAFEHHAIGYITKPIANEKLIHAVQHAKERIRQKNGNHYLFSLFEAKMTQHEETKISLSTLHGLIFLNKEDVMYCESNGNYTHFFTHEGKKIIVSRQLGEYEKLLSDHFFIRIHERYIINLKYVTEYIKGRGGEIKLNHTITLPVSASRKDILLSRFQKWTKR